MYFISDYTGISLIIWKRVFGIMINMSIIVVSHGFQSKENKKGEVK